MTFKSHLSKIIAGALVLAAFFTFLNLNQPNTSANSVSPTAEPGWRQQEITELQTTLASATNPSVRELIQNKLAVLQYRESVVAESKNSPAEKPADPCAVQPAAETAAEPARKTGISVEGPLPFRSEDFHIQNQWLDQVNGLWTHVYAGSFGNNDAQGVIVLWFESGYGAVTVAAPQTDGALTITAVENARLTLQSVNGAIYYFDVPAQQFVGSLEEEVPAVAMPLSSQPDLNICQ